MPHIVTSAAVQITAGQRAHFLERDAIVPEGVDEAVLDRLVKEGMIAVLEVADPEPAPAATFTQDDVDAAVKSAVEAKAAELSEPLKLATTEIETARTALEQEKTELATERTALEQEKTDLATAKAAFEKQQNTPAKPATAAKPAAAKQS